MTSINHHGVSTPEAICINHLREKMKLWENFGTELQQNLRTLHILKIMTGCTILYEYT